jgi:hypothetical protein
VRLPSAFLFLSKFLVIRRFILRLSLANNDKHIPPAAGRPHLAKSAGFGMTLATLADGWKLVPGEYLFMVGGLSQALPLSRKVTLN